MSAVSIKYPIVKFVTGVIYSTDHSTSLIHISNTKLMSFCWGTVDANASFVLLPGRWGRSFWRVGLGGQYV